MCFAGFVRDDGGAYLGLCAGAYYASAQVEFEVGTRFDSCALCTQMRGAVFAVLLMAKE